MTARFRPQITPEPGGVFLDAGSFDLIKQHRDAVRAIHMWTELKDQVREQLIKIMGDASFAHYAGQRVLTITRTRPKRFDTKAFAADNPGLYEQYLREPDEDEIRVSVSRDLPDETAGVIS